MSESEQEQQMPPGETGRETPEESGDDEAPAPAEGDTHEDPAPGGDEAPTG